MSTLVGSGRLWHRLRDPDLDRGEELMARAGALVVSLVFSVLSFGCGGGGSSDSDPEGSAPPPEAPGEARACTDLEPQASGSAVTCSSLSAADQRSSDELATIWGTEPPAICAYDPFQGGGAGFSECGPRVPDNAYYCSRDGEIGWDFFFLDRQGVAFGDFASFTIIAHEWGHLVQDVAGVLTAPNLLPVERELQADCLAGVSAAIAEDRGFLAPRDLQSSFSTLCEAGDPAGLGFWDPRAHGTCGQREGAFLLGLSAARRQLGGLCDETPIPDAQAICSRIELGPVPEPEPEPPSGPEPEPPAELDDERSLFVSATVADVRTGVRLEPGQRFRVTASGTATGFAGGPSGPQGGGIPAPEEFEGSPVPAPGAPIGALVGRIGGAGYFLIGEGTTRTAGRSGELQLMINDARGFLGDNSGGYQVTVRY